KAKTSVAMVIHRRQRRLRRRLGRRFISGGFCSTQQRSGEESRHRTQPAAETAAYPAQDPARRGQKPPLAGGENKQAALDATRANGALNKRHPGSRSPAGQAE